MRFISPHSKRNGAAVSFKEISKQLLDSYKLTQRYRESSLLASWNTLMGSDIAQQTERIFIKDRILYVELGSAALKEELAMTKSLLIGLLNKPYKEQVIDRIVFL